MQIITRKKALEEGSKFYFTGKPCKRGHISLRGISHRDCITCKNITNRNFKEKNPGYNKVWYSNNKDIAAESQRRWARNNPIKYFLRSARTSAKTRNIVFDLSDEFIKTLLIPKFCPSCGKEMVVLPENRFDSPSFDRILNNLGYIDGNIIIVCWRCNRDKSDHYLEYFKFWYELILETKEKLSNKNSKG